ncbi:glycosyltransferase family 4 protein [Synechococcus sp. MU1642]|nr:glycosyltransferase family 4 protein [Synechococcus sp. MU1642]
MTDRPLQIEVLVNSPGPHDQVRIREPFAALQALGVDCRIHERPFLFNDCIRPHSLVIWQRPLPQSRQQQWEHLQWLRKRGCLLLTEWDDHPDLFPAGPRQRLLDQDLAPLRLCHGLHTSCTNLADALRRQNPLTLVLENAVALIPALQMAKHKSGPLRVFIANQNREADQRRMLGGLKRWLAEDPRLELIILADRELASSLPQERIRFAHLLTYKSYRQTMGQCQLALLPLSRSLANSCKTPIKLMECAAESVATVSGPELYGTQAIRGLSVLTESPEQVVEHARRLAYDQTTRENLVAKAHHWVRSEMSLQVHSPQRLWLYEMLWRKRQAIDLLTQERFAGTSLALAGEMMI